MPYELGSSNFAALNLSTRINVASHTAAASGVLIVGMSLHGLTGAGGATITADLTITPSGGAEEPGERWSDTKRSASDTRFRRRAAFVLDVDAGDLVTVYLTSSNPSDTGVSGTVTYRDGLYEPSVISAYDVAQTTANMLEVQHGSGSWTTGSTNLATIELGIETLLTRTAAGVRVQVGSHIADDSQTLVLTQGESYLDAIGNAIIITVTDPRLPDTVVIDGSIATLRIAPVGKREGGKVEAVGVIPTHDANTGATVFQFEIGRAETATLRAGIEQCTWEVDVAVAGDAESVLTCVAAAPCTVRPHIA